MVDLAHLFGNLNLHSKVDHQFLRDGNLEEVVSLLENDISVLQATYESISENIGTRQMTKDEPFMLSLVSVHKLVVRVLVISLNVIRHGNAAQKIQAMTLCSILRASMASALPGVLKNTDNLVLAPEIGSGMFAIFYVQKELCVNMYMSVGNEFVRELAGIGWSALHPKNLVEDTEVPDLDEEAVSRCRKQFHWLALICVACHLDVRNCLRPLLFPIARRFWSHHLGHGPTHRLDRFDWVVSDLVAIIAYYIPIIRTVFQPVLDMVLGFSSFAVDEAFLSFMYCLISLRLASDVDTVIRYLVSSLPGIDDASASDNVSEASISEVIPDTLHVILKMMNDIVEAEVRTSGLVHNSLSEGYSAGSLLDSGARSLDFFFAPACFPGNVVREQGKQTINDEIIAAASHMAQVEDCINKLDFEHGELAHLEQSSENEYADPPEAIDSSVVFHHMRSHRLDMLQWVCDVAYSRAGSDGGLNTILVSGIDRSILHRDLGKSPGPGLVSSAEHRGFETHLLGEYISVLGRQDDYVSKRESSLNMTHLRCLGMDFVGLWARIERKFLLGELDKIFDSDSAWRVEKDDIVLRGDVPMIECTRSVTTLLGEVMGRLSLTSFPEVLRNVTLTAVIPFLESFIDEVHLVVKSSFSKAETVSEFSHFAVLLRSLGLLIEKLQECSNDARFLRPGSVMFGSNTSASIWGSIAAHYEEVQQEIVSSFCNTFVLRLAVLTRAYQQANRFSSSGAKESAKAKGFGIKLFAVLGLQKEGRGEAEPSNVAPASKLSDLLSEGVSFTGNVLEVIEEHLKLFPVLHGELWQSMARHVDAFLFRKMITQKHGYYSQCQGLRLQGELHELFACWGHVSSRPENFLKMSKEACIVVSLPDDSLHSLERLLGGDSERVKSNLRDHGVFSTSVERLRSILAVRLPPRKHNAP